MSRIRHVHISVDKQKEKMPQKMYNVVLTEKQLRTLKAIVTEFDIKLLRNPVDGATAIIPKSTPENATIKIPKDALYFAFFGQDINDSPLKPPVKPVTTKPTIEERLGVNHILNQTRLWKTADGRVMPTREMHMGHIENTLNWLVSNRVGRFAGDLTPDEIKQTSMYRYLRSLLATHYSFVDKDLDANLENI